MKFLIDRKFSLHFPFLRQISHMRCFVKIFLSRRCTLSLNQLIILPRQRNMLELPRQA